MQAPVNGKQRERQGKSCADWGKPSRAMALNFDRNTHR